MAAIDDSKTEVIPANQINDSQSSDKLARVIYNSLIKTKRKRAFGIDPKNKDKLVIDPS